MLVRTSAVVGGGLTLLTIVGVTTIFGEFLLAFVAPSPGESRVNAPAVTAAPAATAGQSPASRGEPGSPVPAGSVGGAGVPAPAGGAQAQSRRQP